MFVTDATSLPRLMACHGSRLMGGILPPVTTNTETRDEGIAAHYVATAVASGQFTIEELIDRKAPNGVYITVEMAEHVSDYLTALTSRGANLTLEWSHVLQGQNWCVNGRADHMGFTGDTLYIDDFKYGHRLVEPENNWTLIAHAISACLGLPEKPTRCVLTIHQPRGYHPDGPVRSVVYMLDQIWAFFQELDRNLSSLSDELRTGEHCSLCHALASCPAANRAAMNAIDASEMAFDDDMSDANLSAQLDTMDRAAKALSDRKKALEELALHRLKSGRVIENYSIERQLGNRTWQSHLDATTLMLLTGVDLTEKKLLTPAKAEKMGVSETLVKTLSYRPESGAKLKRVSAHKKAARLFGDR